MRLVEGPPVLPARPRDQDKWSAGKVLVIGGSRGMSGAPRLAALGALAAGAGLVTVACPEEIRAELAGTEKRILTGGQRSTSAGSLAYVAWSDLVPLMATAQAIVVGPGAGRHPDTLDLLRRIVLDSQCNCVVDADALFACIDQPLRRAGPRRVYTPHLIEASRLLKEDPSVVAARRQDACERIQAESGGVVVLKGPSTFIASSGDVVESRRGSPILATGGSGDVLAGLIGGFLASGIDPAAAALFGVLILGIAAEEAASQDGTLDDVIARLPHLVERHRSERS